MMILATWREGATKRKERNGGSNEAETGAGMEEGDLNNLLILLVFSLKKNVKVCYLWQLHMAGTTLSSRL